MKVASISVGGWKRGRRRMRDFLIWGRGMRGGGRGLEEFGLGGWVGWVDWGGSGGMACGLGRWSLLAGGAGRAFPFASPSVVVI